MYASLNDAAVIDPLFAAGSHVKIWYTKSQYGRTFSCGIGFAVEVEGTEFDLNKINETHTLLGEIAGAPDITADEVASIMQGEYWSPRAEARDLIRSKGLSHTTFQQGDIVQIGDKFYTNHKFEYIEFNNDTFTKHTEA